MASQEGFDFNSTLIVNEVFQDTYFIKVEHGDCSGLLSDCTVESLRRETTEGQWSKKRKTSPTRRHKRNRSLKNKEVTEPDMEVSNGECHECYTMTISFPGLYPT